MVVVARDAAIKLTGGVEGCVCVFQNNGTL